MVARPCWLVAACLVLAPAVGRANRPAVDRADLAPREAVAQAERRLAALDYEGAQRLLDATWRRGDSDVALAGTIAALAARAAASLDDAAGAQRWYRQWLCVAPRAALPDGTAPALQAAFDAARAGLGAHWLRASAERSGDGIAVRVLDDPCGQAAAVRDGDRRVALQGGAAALGRSIAATLDVIDGYGNALATVAVTDAPTAHRAWYGRPVTWGIAGGAALVLGAVSLYVAVDARDQLQSLAATSAASSAYYDDSGAPALQQRFDRASAAGTLLVGGALVAGVAAAVLWIRGPDAPPRSHITVGGTTAGWSVAF
jgi:hypothetical protein